MSHYLDPKELARIARSFPRTSVPPEFVETIVNALLVLISRVEWLEEENERRDRGPDSYGPDCTCCQQHGEQT